MDSSESYRLVKLPRGQEQLIRCKLTLVLKGAPRLEGGRGYTYEPGAIVAVVAQNACLSTGMQIVRCMLHSLVSQRQPSEPH